MTDMRWIGYHSWGLNDTRGYEVTFTRAVGGHERLRTTSYRVTEASALRVLFLARELAARHGWYVNPTYAGWSAYAPGSWRPVGFNPGEEEA